MKFTEAMLEEYSKPLSETEDNHCKNAIRMVSDALKPLGFTDDGKGITKLCADTFAYSIELKNASEGRRIKLFVQGSYANNTNVRTKSDVDIAVVQEDVFQTKYRTSGSYVQSDADYNFYVAEARPISFKDEVEKCLIVKFGKDVERKKKSIKVHGNAYRKDADAVPCKRYRDYTNDYRKDVNNYIGAISIRTDDGETIINYPEQHIKNGREKNNATNYLYKKLVRILKKIRYMMEENGYKSTQDVSSFALESLLWNIPDSYYLEWGKYRKVDAFKQLIALLIAQKPQFSYYKEANGIKDLFKDNAQISNMFDFLNDLNDFYEYE